MSRQAPYVGRSKIIYVPPVLRRPLIESSVPKRVPHGATRHVWSYPCCFAARTRHFRRWQRAARHASSAHDVFRHETLRCRHVAAHTNDARQVGALCALKRSGREAWSRRAGALQVE